MVMHADELPVSADLVRKLVDEQFPRWRGLPVSRVSSPGTVNAIFRVGERLAARLPLRGTDAAAARLLLESEAAAARELAGATRFPVPEQVALGEPGHGYPLPWSVQAWLPGRTGDEDDPAGSVGFARDLAEFIAGVRAIGTRGRTFSGRGRGGDLKAHDAWMSTCLRESEGILDVGRLSRMWAAFRELPREAPDVMSHGDLTPGNVLVAGGHLAGVLDVGDFRAADPALDLISAWNLLADRPRLVLRDALRCTDLDWERGKAWAFQQAMGLVWYYAETNPVMSRLGRVTLDRIQSAGRPLTKGDFRAFASSGQLHGRTAFGAAPAAYQTISSQAGQLSGWPAEPSAGRTSGSWGRVGVRGGVSRRLARSNCCPSCHGIGLASRYPWPYSQPISVTSLHCSLVSMPSAMTSMPSVLAIATMPLARASRRCEAVMPSTKVLSIFRTSTGSSRR